MSDAPDAPVTLTNFVENPPDTFWVSRVVVAEPVHAVSAANGLMVAAGASLHQLRPGSTRVRSAALPVTMGAPPGAAPSSAPKPPATAGDGDVVAVLAEPWSPFRLIVAWKTKVCLFSGHQPHEPLLSMSIQGTEHGATHLAWMRLQGTSTFYVRQRSGEVLQVNLDTGAMGTVNLAKAYAIASDPRGVLAVLVKSGDNDGLMNLQVLPAGEKAWDVYGIDFTETDEDDPEQGRLYLAAHGRAVAVGGDGHSAEVSWEPEEEGWRDLKMVPAVFHGPLAFRSEKEIFAAYNVEGQVHVRRHVRGQGVTRIARYGLDDDWQGSEVTVTSIAWDEERRTLWAASPELGLMALTQPD